MEGAYLHKIQNGDESPQENSEGAEIRSGFLFVEVDERSRLNENFFSY